jgi:hypothetical protein
MSSLLKNRVLALEIVAKPSKAWCCQDIVDEPTQQQWEQLNAAHADGRECYLFREDATMGVWLVGADNILWSNEL